MIEKIYTFYIKELSFYSLVYKKVNIWLRLLVLSLLLCGFIYMGYYVAYQNSFLLVLGFGFAAIALLLNHCFIVLTIKRNYPEHSISWFSWSGSGFHNDAIRKLETYLRQQNIDKEKSEILQDLLKDKALRERTNSIVFLSCFAVLFVPLWSAYLDHFFEGIKDIELLSKMFVLFLMFIFLISFLMMNLADFRDNIFTRFMKLNKLSDLISEVWLSSNR